MGLYVEVMCDERKEWPAGYNSRSVLHRCHSHNNDNPQGPSIAAARSEAKAAGWLIKGRRSVCPGCLEILPGEQP
jgi:hypothetical protein